MDRYFAFIDAAFKIVIAVAAAWSAYLFGYQKQQNDDVKLVTEMLSDEKPQKRLIGVGLATAFIKDRRIPEEVFASVMLQVRDFGGPGASRSGTPDSREVAPTGLREAAAVALSSAAATNPAIKSQVDTANANLPIRIYLQTANLADRIAANAFGDRLERTTTDVGLDRDIAVPDAEARLDYGGRTELRCFKAAECRDVAPKLVKLLKAQGVTNLADQPVDLSRRYENSPKLRPMHFEVWFASGTVPK